MAGAGTANDEIGTSVAANTLLLGAGAGQDDHHNRLLVARRTR